MFTWSESAAGTNGMGTALGRTRAVGVYGPEHWCASLHDWNCNGVSVGDATCGGSLAVLNISFWRTTPSAALGEDLERAVAPLRALVRDCAMRDGTALVEAFSGVSRASPSGGARRVRRSCQRSPRNPRRDWRRIRRGSAPPVSTSSESR
jgi:transcriptional regulator of acetoin/glycerol metabolism